MPFQSFFNSSKRSLIKQKIKKIFTGINEIYLEEIIEFYNLEKNSMETISNRIIEKLLELEGYPKDGNSSVTNGSCSSVTNGSCNSVKNGSCSSVKNGSCSSVMNGSCSSVKNGSCSSVMNGSCSSVKSESFLNHYLLLLMEMFPEVGAVAIRDLLTRFNGGDCIPYIVDKIIGMKNNTYEKRLLGQMVREKDLFREEEYISQAKKLLLNEFPYHWDSTISAVMAESNNYYPDCYTKLGEIKPSNLWTTFLPFTKRSWVDFEINHKELAREIEEMDRSKMQDLLDNDEFVAAQLNYKEYLDSNQLITCQCCFGEYAFEELGQCEDGHLFCQTCISQSIKIGLFDTGNLRNGKNLRCMSSEYECKAEFSVDEVKRNCSKELFIQYQGFLWQAAIKQIKNIDYIICPFCKYAEEMPKSSLLTKYLPLIFDTLLKRGPSLIRLCSAIFMVCVSITSPLVALIILLFYNYVISKHKGTILFYLKRKIHIPAWARHKSILIMNCKNPDCLKVTCGECGELWVAPHKCFEKQVDSLRLYVENAKSNALIRICPSCSIRFSKIDGCNKMTCPNCKYEMCYICRQDIGNQKYDHFCQHFRLVPGSDCSECKKCDLFQKERDDVAVANAARKAEKEWMALYPNDAAKCIQ